MTAHSLSRVLSICYTLNPEGKEFQASFKKKSHDKHYSRIVIHESFFRPLTSSFRREGLNTSNLHRKHYQYLRRAKELRQLFAKVSRYQRQVIHVNSQGSVQVRTRIPSRAAECGSVSTSHNNKITHIDYAVPIQVFWNG